MSEATGATAPVEPYFPTLPFTPAQLEAKLQARFGEKVALTTLRESPTCPLQDLTIGECSIRLESAENRLVKIQLQSKLKTDDDLSTLETVLLDCVHIAAPHPEDSQTIAKWLDNVFEESRFDENTVAKPIPNGWVMAVRSRTLQKFTVWFIAAW
jgi:hypothetical protein